MGALTTSLPFGLGGGWLAEHTLRAVGAGIAVFDHEGGLVQVDDRSADLLSLPAPHRIGAEQGMRLDDARWSTVHLDGSVLDETTDPVRVALSSGSSVADVIGVRDLAGDTRWLAVTALPLPGLDGAAQAVLASLVEVTGVIRDRAAVDAAERLGRSTFDRTSTPMCVVDGAGRIVDWNRAFAGHVDRPDFEIMSTSLDAWVVGGSYLVASLERDDAGDGDGVETEWADGTPTVARTWRDDRGDGRTTVELTSPRRGPSDEERFPSDAAAVVIDGVGRIATGNAAFGDLIRSSIQDLRGNRLELFLDVPAEAFQRCIDGVRADGSERRFTTRLHRLGDADVAVDIVITRASALRNDDVMAIIEPTES